MGSFFSPLGGLEVFFLGLGFGNGDRKWAWQGLLCGGSDGVGCLRWAEQNSDEPRMENGCVIGRACGDVRGTSKHKLKCRDLG